MKYVLAVNQPAYGSQGSFLAYQFACELVLAGHEITQVFFYQAGVGNGNRFVYPNSDEFHLVKAWQQFAVQHNVPLNLCIAAAQRRGVVNAETAYSAEQTNLADGFCLAGLGEFSQAILQADRLITL
ncbi:sulfurtransferase complex subunit TusD [Conservatibacter flavescens]|uniref:Sulfurtransferase complex subunit TusD n=1 Tax=Conservatibacter flavescens TaxID=28161 RepID=A0A2M8RZZ7_9PAST|nr:sulfurtransferase complex subunit TusD [Conservatibacter flavescens]PJG84467.1 sulfurtransferase complex subunit TusD [Conservatibacter flavescens]